MKSFSIQRLISFSQTDRAGVVHFSEFFKLMEDAEHALFRSMGHPIVAKIDGRRYLWPRVNATFDFHHPVYFEDPVEVRIAVDELGESSVTFTCGIFRSDELMASGKSTTVCCERMPDYSLESCPIPQKIREGLLDS